MGLVMGLVMSFLLLAFALVTAWLEVTERATQPVFRGLGDGTLTIMNVPENVPLEFYTVQCVSTDSDPASFSVKRSGEDAVPLTAIVGDLYQEVEPGVSFRIDRGEEDFAVGDTFSFVTYPDMEELDKLFDRWVKRYVKWIISREEKDRFEELTATEDKLGFMESFWKRRDMSPETPENEARKEHQRRFAHATQHYGAGTPGWATDMGKIYILLGPPSSINRNPAGRTAFERPSEVWTYNNAPSPRLPASFDIGFVDFTATGRYEIVNASNLDVLAPLRTNIGWAMSELDAIGLMRSGGSLMEPNTGLRTEIRPDQMVMDQFDFQRNLLEVAKVPELNLPSLREVTEARADFPSVPLTTTAAFFPSEGGSAWVPITVSMPYARPHTSNDGGRDRLQLRGRHPGSSCRRVGHRTAPDRGTPPNPIPGRRLGCLPSQPDALRSIGEFGSRYLSDRIPGSGQPQRCGGSRLGHYRSPGLDRRGTQALESPSGERCGRDRSTPRRGSTHSLPVRELALDTQRPSTLRSNVDPDRLRSGSRLLVGPDNQSGETAGRLLHSQGRETLLQSGTVLPPTIQEIECGGEERHIAQGTSTGKLHSARPGHRREHRAGRGAGR